MRTFSSSLLVLTLIAFGLATALRVVAQSPVPNGRLYVLHEGTTQRPGSIGFVGFPGGFYEQIDTVGGSGTFNNSLLLGDSLLYIATGNGNIVAYDLRTRTRVVTIPGADARQMAVWNNQLLVTCSEAPYFRVFDRANNHSLIYSLPDTKVRQFAEGITVVGNRAFVAVNGSFMAVIGEVAVIDLVAQDTLAVITTDDNPNDIVAHNGRVFVQCLNYTPGEGLSIQEIDPVGLSIVRTDSVGLVAYGGFEINDSLIYFNNNDVFGQEALASFNYLTHTVNPSVQAGAFYGLEFNAEAEAVFVSETDYTTTGSIRFWQNGVLSDSVVTEVSPRSLWFVPDSLPVIKLPQDRNLCSTTTLNLTAGFPGPQYLWYNGQSGNSINATVGQTTVIWVMVTNRGKTVFDTLNVTFNLPTVNVPSSINFCQGSSRDITATGNFISLQWSTGDTSRTITVTQPGLYIATGFSPSGCPLSDTTVVTTNPSPTGDIVFSPNPGGLNDTVTISFNLSPANTQVTNVNFENGTILSGTGNGPYLVVFDQLGLNTLDVNLQVPGGCNARLVESIEIVEPTGLSTSAVASALKLYPSPSHGPLIIDTPQGFIDGQLTVTSLTGQILKDAPVSGGTLTLDGSAWPTGVYIIRLQAPGQPAWVGRWVRL